MQHAVSEPLAQQLDAASIIALWLAIHGGDPLESDVDVAATAGKIIASLATFAFGTAPAVNVAELKARLAQLNVRVNDGPDSGSRPAPELRIVDNGSYRVIYVDGIEIDVPGGGARTLR
jgi:hypothetical protein